MAKILVVDDEKVMVKGIRFNLENEGYTVDVGYNGRQAVDLARANDYAGAGRLGGLHGDPVLFLRPHHHAHRPEPRHGQALGL